MERENMLHPQRNFHPLNHLHFEPPAVGGNNSEFRQPSTSERHHNFYHSMPAYDHTYGPQCYGSSAAIHNPVHLFGVAISVCFPSEHHPRDHIPHPQNNYAPQSYGSLSAIHNRNPSIQNNSYSNLHSDQPIQHLLERSTLVNNGEIGWIVSLTQQCTGISFPYGINFVEGSPETREMRMTPSPAYGMHGFVDPHSHPPYINNYQLHWTPLLPHTQPMRGNNVNLQPQVPSTSSQGHQTFNTQHPYNSRFVLSSGTNGRSQNFRSSAPLNQMINQDNLPSEPNVFDHDRITGQYTGQYQMINQDNLPSEPNVFDHDRITGQYTDDVLLVDAFHTVSYPLFGDEDVLLSDENLIYHEVHRSTGLSKQEIQGHLKIRTHSSSAFQFDLDEAPRSKIPKRCGKQLDSNESRPDSDEEPDICVVCQVEYENQDIIGTLECGHEYHAECIKKWLHEKNVCPVCKATALSIQS